jgi:exonuclease SbcD
MIRILHTADWHLGQQLNGWSRLSEHAAFFDWLAGFVRAQEIDALIVAGDIFDTQNPSAEVRRLFFDAIGRLRDQQRHLTIVVVAGNHDHAGHLEAPASVLRRAGVNVLGTIARAGTRYDLSRHLIPLYDAEGRISAYVLAVPFPHPGILPVVTPLESGGEPRGILAVRRLYADLIAGARATIGGLPLVVTGHLAVVAAGDRQPAPGTNEGERPILIGGAETVPHDVFPEDVSYVALGHIHREHSVGRPNIRYSGSPFPLSYGERDYRHGVTLITVDYSRKAETEHVQVPRPVPMLRVPTAGYLRPDEIESALARLDADHTAQIENRPFVHIAVEVDGPAAGLRLEIQQMAERFPIRLAGPPEIKRPSPSSGTSIDTVPEYRLQDLDPRRLFAEAFEREHGVPPDSVHYDAFGQLLQEVG